MRILLAGNTGYINENFITKAFPEYHILIMGNPAVKTDRKKKIISIPVPEDEWEMKDIFEAYELECVVYFSDNLTFNSEREGELERLNKFLYYCSEEGNTQVVYLTGPQAGFEQTDGKTMLAEAAEQLCQHYCENSNIKIKIIRLPYLYSATLEQDYLCRLFQSMEKKQKIIFPGNPWQKIFFLCMEDLAELLYRILDEQNNINETLCVPDCFGLTFLEFGGALQELEEGLEIEYTENAPPQEIPKDDKLLRRRYNWFPRISIRAELPELYDEYRQQQRWEGGRWEKLKKWLKKYGKLGQAAELLVGFVLLELLNRFVGNSVQFRMIDLRLLFVVLMGMIYGINMGLLAAALGSLSLIAAYYREGTHWITLFYEPGNWIPFIAYFTVGAICGYVRLRNRDYISFVQKENDLIQEKFFFMRRLYRDTLQDKKEYKKQIVGAKDSFGKIFDITRQLDVVRPQEIFIKTIKVLEEVLENQSISLYSIGKNKNFARLEAASKEISRKIPRSIRIEEYPKAMEVLEEEDVWSNTELLEGYPMYMAGIRRDSGLVMLILVEEADYSQMTLYYTNLLKILCGLIGTSLLRALDYQAAIHREQYLEGTHIMKEENFMDILKLQHSMLEQKIADYTLLQLDRKGMTIEEADEILQSKTRENDILGISSEGILYLILTQTAEEHVPLVVQRLEDAGFGCKVTLQIGEDYSYR